MKNWCSSLGSALAAPKTLLLSAAAITLPSCKLPDMSGFSKAEPPSIRSSERESLAAAGSSQFTGEKQWADHFYRPITTGWGKTTPTTLDEDAAAHFAISHGLNSAVGEIELSRAEAQQNLARSSFLPKLIAQVDAGQDVDRFPLNIDQQDFDFGAGLYLKQDVFSWGANRDRYQSAKLRTTGQRQQLEVLRNTTAATVRVGIANYRRTQAQIAAYGQGVSALEKLASTARERAAAGLDSKRSVAELESRLAEFGSRKAALQAEAEGVRDELTNLLGSKVPLKFKVGSGSTLKPPSLNRDALVNRGLAHRPDIKAMATLAQVARGELNATKKSRLPTISLSAGVKGEYDLDGSERGPDFRAGANSRWVPIAGGEHRANVNIAEADLRRAELDLAHARRTTISGINGTHAQLAATERALKVCYRSLESSRTAQTLSQQVYEQDSEGIDSLIEAHENVVRNLANHAETQADRDLALIKLHHLLGSSLEGGAKAGFAKN